MEYQESLDYLYGLQHFGIKLGLENIRILLTRLGHPEARFPIVHVAGTNGKGSVCATLAEILQRAGYRVGLYTSPHLHTFGERIRVDGVPLAEPQIAALTWAVRHHCTGLSPTFFEFTTAMALQHFAASEVEVAILEVGMGGRLDATNAVSPCLSVITSVSLDHTEHLGADLAAIAAEKGGIIKTGVPVVIGRQDEEALSVLLARAEACRAPAVLFGRDYRWAAGTLDFSGPGLEMEALEPGLAGSHQRDNLALALAVIALLRQQGLVVPESAIRAGVTAVRWPGRLEAWDDGRILLDGAHNGAGATALAAYLQEQQVAGIHWVVGIKADKAADALLAPLLPLCRGLYCTTPPGVAGVPPERLAASAAALGVPAQVFAEPRAALEAARDARRGDELVVVAGSLFLVAAVRAMLSCPKGVA